jgi:CheY-like chemotaxis protein
MIIAVVDDMIFISKIRAAAETLNVAIRFVRNSEALFAAVRESAPALIIVDLHSQKVNPLAMAKTLKTDAALQNIPLLGFYSHVETELRQQAEAAGFDRLMPRSAFSANLAQILAPS